MNLKIAFWGTVWIAHLLPLPLVGALACLVLIFWEDLGLPVERNN